MPSISQLRSDSPLTSIAFAMSFSGASNSANAPPVHNRVPELTLNCRCIETRPACWSCLSAQYGHILHTDNRMCSRADHTLVGVNAGSVRRSQLWQIIPPAEGVYPVKHTVHLYALVRVPVPDVEADSHAEAVSKASRMVDLDEVFRDLASHATRLNAIEYADEISHVLVDEDGDSEYDRSRWYTWNEINQLTEMDLKKTRVHPVGT